MESKGLLEVSCIPQLVEDKIIWETPSYKGL